MASCVATTSQKSYLCTNRRLVMYLYRKATIEGCDKSRAFFKDDTFEAIHLAVTNNPEDRQMLLKTTTTILKCFTNSHNNPFNLQALTFDVVTTYMLGRHKINRDGTVGTLSTSSFEAIRSAYAHLLRIAGEKPHESLNRMRQFMGGMKRTVAKDIQDEGMSCEPGKSPMSFPVYKRLCLILSRSKHPECIFARCWLTLEWNLISRAESCARTHMNHIEWRDDCLILFLPITKTNQEGVDRSIPWHIFANPKAPEICCIHALAIYLFTNPQLLMGDARLFPGTRQYNRYIEIISKTIANNRQELEQFGNISNLGSHSIRKGAASYCASGSTISPPIVSICLRANWSIGGSKERYLKFENAGDQFVGRMVSGLDAFSPLFAISPPFFHQDVNEDDVIKAFLEENMIIADSHTHLVKMLLACVSYNWEWYSNVMHALNPFKTSIVFSKLTPLIIRKSIIAFPWQDDRSPSCPKFSGIPPHVTIVTMLQNIKDGQGQVTQDVVDNIIQELNDRGTFGGFSETRMQVLMNRMIQDVTNEITTVVERHIPAGTTTPAAENTARTNFNYSFLGGQMHMLPEGWVLPHGMNLRACFGLWFVGIKSVNVPPFCFIRRLSEFEHLVEGKKRYSEMKFLFRVVERFGRERNLWIQDVRGWTENLVQRLYDGVATSLLGYELQRFHTKSWATVVKRLRTVERQRRGN